MSKLQASLVSQIVKNPPAMQETLVQFLGWEDPLEKDEKGPPTFYFPLTPNTHYTGGEAEARKGTMTCRRSHSRSGTRRSRSTTEGAAPQSLRLGLSILDVPLKWAPAAATGREGASLWVCGGVRGENFFSSER